MRFLKNKIAKSKSLLLKRNPAKSSLGMNEPLKGIPKILNHSKKIFTTSHKKSAPHSDGEVRCKDPKLILVTKNVVKNYGRAIANFACSALSVPYLENIQKIIPFSLNTFLDYAAQVKGVIQSITSFRDAILVKENDSITTKTNKLVLQRIAEIFIKYFSVNWISSSKLFYKLEYLKLRGTILRKIRSPETFLKLNFSE